MTMDIFEYTDKKLKAHYQNNKDFTVELVSTYEYYKELLLSIVKDSDKERLENSLLQSIKSQIFNGYFMAQELLNSEEISFENDWFKQSKGAIAQQLPEMLRINTDDRIEDIITHKPLKNMASWLVIEYEGVYPLLMDISLNTACLGAKWAFIDEAKKRGISHYQPSYSGMLGYVDEVLFISPQTYMVCDVTNESSEFWTIVNSKYNGYDKIAEVTVIQSTDNYYLNIYIKNTVSIDEQKTLIDHLAVRLMTQKKIEREQLILSASSVEEFYEINNPVN